MELFDFLITLMTILCTIWIVMHIYNNYRKIKPIDEIDGQISWIFSGGKLPL